MTMNQPGDLQKKTLIDQILNSPEFHDSKRYQELLQYLISKSANSESLKEAEIAHDLFGKDSKFDPSTDPLIRSYISNLRKKLEHYYLTTSDNNEFRLEIPKGHYIVKYTQIVKNDEPDKTIKFQKFIYPSLLLILSAAIIFLLSMKGTSGIISKNSENPNPIWNEFLVENSHPTLIVIGEYLVLSEKDRSAGRSFTRMPNINSEQEFNIISKQEPKKYSGLEISEVTYIGAGATLGSVLLMKELAGSSKKISVKLSHELKWDDIENYNIIYIGTFKSLYTLDTLFSRTNLRYHLRPNRLSIIDSKKDTVRSLKLSWVGGSLQKDYSVILKRPSSKGKTIMFLLGFSEVGVMESIKSLLDKNFNSKLNKFSQNLDINKLHNFELILEVEGLKYSVFNSKIIYAQNF